MASSNTSTKLPHPKPCIAYWQQPPDDIADLKTTSTLPKDADIVIIGSGISGSGIAYNLLTARPDLKVVMLEARQACSGASGRNGGHTKTASYISFLENINAVGEEDAIRIAKLEYDCMAGVHTFIKEKGIQCDAKRCDTVDVYYDQGRLDLAKDSVKRMEELIGNSHPCSQHTFYSPQETKEHFFAEDSLGSVKYDAGSLSAYKLTIGILKLALDLGLNLQTNTAATRISNTTSDSPHWTVATSRGDITTPTLILATNGYTASLLPELQEVIVPFRGIVTAQRPGQSLPHAGNLPTTYSFVYKEGFEYMITRPAISGDSPTANGNHVSPTSGTEYDIVIGGGFTKAPSQGLTELCTTDDTTASIPVEVTSYLTSCTASFFGPGTNWGPDHAAGRVRHTWSGIMGYSADGHPLVGQYPAKDGLWLDASFQGHGMVLCWLCAKAVAAMVLGCEKEDEVQKWFPESFRVTKERLAKRFDAGVLTG